MASSKKPTYKVEIKPINERKRRKSDLVIMWQSIWDLSLCVVWKCWYISSRIWDLTTDVWMKADEQHEIRTWLEKHLAVAPQDFSASWRDGVLLGMLLNKLQPGCYPDAENLDIDYGLRNVYRAFNILEARFNIVPKVSAEEIVTCSHGSDAKLQELLLQIRNETDNKFTDDKKTKEESEQSKDEKSQAAYDSKSCIAKGTGLLVGFVGREANFVVFYTSMLELNLVVEIKGPSNSICSERITKRSPKRKQSVKLWKPSLLNSVARSLSESNDHSSSVNEDQPIKVEPERRDIPMKYEIHANHINFSYMPFVKGQHTISILYEGQHISESPYNVTVEPAVGTYRNTDSCLKSVLKHPNSLQVSNDLNSIKKESVRFQEPDVLESKKSVGKVVKRRVLRYIVKINRKDIEVDADGIDHLASALLKMDYELQKRPLSRRNSWGFVGDAERKVSMIRQFCVDLDELEVQSSKMHRSLSLSINSKTKRHFPKNNSYECEDIIGRPKLETVTEGRDLDTKATLLQHYADNEMFAFLDEEFDSKKVPDEIPHNETEWDPEPLKESRSTENPGVDITLINNPGQISRRLNSEISEQDSLKSQGSETSNEFLDSPGLVKEFSGELDSISNDVFMSNPFVNKMNKKPQSIPPNDHQNLEKDLFFLTNPFCFDIDKMKTDPRVEIKDYSATKTESLSKYDAISESKNQESVLIEEKPFTKTDAKNVQSSCYVQGEQISPSIIKLKTKDNENNFRYSESEFSKVFNFQGNKNMVADKVSSVKEREELNHFERIACPKPCNKLSSSIATKRRKNYSDKVQKNQYKTPKYDTILRNLKHFSLTNDTKDHNCKLENQEAKYTSNSVKCNPNTPVRSPDDFCINSEQMFSKFEHASSKTLLLNSDVKTGDKVPDSNITENAVTSFRRVSDESIKNNEIRPRTENILSRVHSTPKNELLSSKLPWNLYNSTNGCHSYKDTNVNKINNFFDNRPTNRNAEKVPKQGSQAAGISNSNEESPHSNFSIQKRTLVSLGQFNFRHFNPAVQSNRDGPVKFRIRQWQNAKNDKSTVSNVAQKVETLPEKGNITEKLKFWEGFQRKSDIALPKNEQTSSECHKELNETLKVKQMVKGDGNAESEESNSIPFNMTRTDQGTQLKAIPADDTKSKIKENLYSPNNDNNVLWEKQNGDKLSIPLTATRIRKRSFSDPGDLETSRKTNGSGLSEHVEILQEQSRENLSSSSDVNYLELFADDEISSVDLLYSTEDEYIDDEISESASTYWGDISFIKNLKLTDSATYREFCSLVDSEYCKDVRESPPSCPYECKVFGIANYFGHVAVKNRFRVLTNGAGCGNLSATVQGLGQHEVSFVSVEYVRKDVYEVTYQVLSPGLYLISVRWMDNPISGSPFLCKVTF